MKFGRDIDGWGHHGFVIGPLEVLVWKDCNKRNRFRTYFWRHKQTFFNVCTYHWIFKAFSYWTLWVAWRGPAHSGK